MTTKKIAVFSTGIPDPSQGGSGIFNYYVIRELLDRGHEVHCYFLASKSFLKGHTVNGFLEELCSKGLQYTVVDEQGKKRRSAWGFELLLQSHNVDVCTRIVDTLNSEGKTYDAYIAHDLGWIIALAGQAEPVVGLAGDPLHGRLRFGIALDPLVPKTWLVRMKALSVGSKSTLRKLAVRLNGKVILGSFTPNHVEEYRAGGLICRHFRWFSPEVSAFSRTVNWHKEDTFRLLHVGTLTSTASSKMLGYWMDDLLPELAKLPFNIEIRFIGRGAKFYESQWDNIRLAFLGHEESLEKEFERCDAFFSPMRYPVGTRTRILTAISYGVPTIADHSASLGLPELKDGEDIFYGRDPRQIANIIKNLKQHPELQEKVGRAARAKWCSFYQPSTNVSAILAAVGA